MDIPQHKSQGLGGSEKPGMGVCSLQTDFDIWSNIVTKAEDLEKATHHLKRVIYPVTVGLTV